MMTLVCKMWGGGKAKIKKYYHKMNEKKTSRSAT